MHLKRPKKYNPPIRKPGGLRARGSKSKANPFVDHLEEVFSPNETSDLVELLVEEKHDLGIVCLMSPKDIKRKIERNMNSKEAPDHMHSPKQVRQAVSLMFLRFPM